MKEIKEKLKQLYYTLTAHVPRALPTTMEEFERLKCILNNYYGVPDAYECWAAVAGHVMSSPATNMRKSYADLSAPAKRIEINKIAQLERQRCARILEEAYAKKALEIVKDETKPVDSIN